MAGPDPPFFLFGGIEHGSYGWYGFPRIEILMDARSGNIHFIRAFRVRFVFPPFAILSKTLY